MKNRNALLIAILVLAFIGIADSWYLASHALSGTELACGIGGYDGCNTVAQSAYSNWFGIPLALYGVAFYIALFALSALLFVIRDLRLLEGLRAVAVVGAAASVVFMLIQIFLIQAICQYCVLSAIVSFLICWLSFRLAKLDGSANPEQAVLPWGK